MHARSGTGSEPGSELSQMVDNPIECLKRSSCMFSRCTGTHNPCQFDRMGSKSGAQDSAKCLEPQGKESKHQLIGASELRANPIEVPELPRG